ncbi:MAG: prepilin-type N-terminal cleavage/methylation domain-containing protein [Planctomycetota bacterium]
MRRRPARAFSIIELLIATAVVSVVLSSALVALDAAFKGYEATTNSASTHAVTRLVMHRMIAMIRTGDEFGPFPVDVLDPATNPLQSDFIEFVSLDDPATGRRDISRIEVRDDPDEELDELWIVINRTQDGEPMGLPIERPLLMNLESAEFTLNYDVGPRLARATIDLAVRPNDDLSETNVNESIYEVADLPPPVRMVASVTPRRLTD